MERAADPYRDTSVIDGRAPRFNQAVVGLVSVVAVTVGPSWLLTVLAAHLPGRNPMQVAVDQFRELVRGFCVAQPPSVEQAGDLVRLAVFRHID